MNCVIKIFFLAFVLVGLVGCEKNEREFAASSEPGMPAGDVVSVEEALGQLSAFQTAMAPNTRSGESSRAVKSIRDISVSGGKAATRSSVGVDLPDTMVYVVNFADNGGFAILGARRSLEPVYAVTESGSFDAGKLDETLARLSVQCMQETSPAPVSDADSFIDIGTDYVYELVAAGLINLPDGGVRPPIGGWGDNGWGDSGTRTFLGYSDWEISEKTGPLVTVKWNQTHPFNMSMDPWDPGDLNYLKFYKNRYPSGCGIIAMAQIMTCVKRPAKAPAGKTVSYDWENLKTISNYENVSLHFLPGAYVGYNIEYARQLADVLYDLGIRFGRQYQNGETVVAPENVIIGLKNMDAGYYADAAFDVVDLDKMYAQLDKGKPLYMQGMIETGAGHAWVVDGYALVKRTGTYVTKYDDESKEDLYLIETQFAHFIHVNWGYSGAHDGYYSISLLDMKDRELKDEVIDENIYDTPGLSLNLRYNNRVIYY